MCADDVYAEGESEQIKARQTDIVVNRKKLARRDVLSEKTLELHLGRKTGQTIPDLHPEVPAWAEKGQSERVEADDESMEGESAAQ